MAIYRRRLSNRIPVKGVLCALILLFFIGCAASAKEFNPDIAGPQMIVQPEVIRLGIAKLKDTEILFRGKGFQPEDSVFIKMLGVKKEGKVVDIPIADGEVDQQGFFTAKVSTLVKISELLRAKIGSNEKMENIVIVTQPPIAEGNYSVIAVSMESDKKAECQLLIKGPSLLDRLKDWIGGLLGKIVKK
ncbi:MAG: hypothetical protein V2J25_06575 [Desulfatiglans sp.]|jgi:hypothetical protein|nr:hypothetical protein [Thermodesulfobacteriota bacterium]MEE4352520.1 hypothetical protein [Desulfatiglans sp.]